MRSLNLDQLRALETVLELASFTAAAKRLNLSQSTVSVQIRELEQRFGLRLVERLGKRALATPAGRELLDHARRIQGDLEQASLAMRRHRDGSAGLVRVGTTTTALNYFLAPVLASLRQRHARIEFAIDVNTTSIQVDRLLADEIDFGVANLPVKERLIEVTPLKDEELVAILPADLPPGERKQVPRYVTPDYMVRHRLLLEFQRAHVRALAMDWLSPASRQLRPAMMLDNFDTISRMVAVGLGASIVPESVIADDPRRKRLLVRPLRPRLTRTLALIQRRNKPLDEAMRVFRAAVLEAGGVRRRAA